MGKAMARGLLTLAFVSLEAAAQFCPGLSPWVFTDVPSNHPFCADITWMAQRGVTLGCAALNATQRLYCPEQSVRRDQMAAFMHRLGDAVQPTTCATGQVLKWDGAKWACAGALTSLSQGNGIVLTPNPTVASGTIAADTAYLQRRVTGSCSAGSSIRTINADGSVACESDDSGPVNAFVQGGNAIGTTAVLGTTSNQPLDIIVNGNPAMRFRPGLSPNLIGGHPSNAMPSSIVGATIAGGGKGGEPNVVHSDFATVGGGAGNQAGDLQAIGNHATVGGGENNTASGRGSTAAGGNNNVASGGTSAVGGGFINSAIGNASTVAGGILNTASGQESFVAGGSQNIASGHSSSALGGALNWAAGASSVAMGYRAKALGTGSFVYSDFTAADFTSGVPNEFLVGATGGIGMYTAKNYTTGCRIDPGGGSWICTSSRTVKRDFTPVDARVTLDKVAALPIFTWRFVKQPVGLRHMGPMAEDFRAAFGLGSDDRSISSVDAQGVALAALQGLNAKLASEIARLEARIADLESRQGRSAPASASASRVSR